jgi:hypothetical protein
VVQPDELGGGDGRVDHGGHQGVEAGAPPDLSLDHDLADDDPDLEGAHPGQERAVPETAAYRQFPVVFHPNQHVGPGGGDRGDELLGREVAIHQNDHAFV